MKDKKTIIFDLGGVILDIDYNLPVLNFKKYGIDQFQEIYTQKSQEQVFDKLEMGKLSEVEFRKYIRTFSTNRTITDENIDYCWNSMIKDLPIQHIIKLEELNALGYNCYLLSNTNSIHVKYFKNLIDKKIGIDRFNRCFKKIYFSNEIGYRKPNANCFEYVLEDAQLNKQDVLFIDDSIQHVNGAINSGIQAYHLFQETILNLNF